MNIVFLGTPSFVQPIKDELVKHFQLVDLLNQADLAVVAAYGRILTIDELNIPKFGFINVHPSLLPKYRGPSPIQAAILNGDKVTGITIIKMDEEVDHGPILYQEEISLSSSENFDTLSTKMFLRAAEILPKIIEDFIAGKIIAKPQDHSLATYCDKLTRESGYFDINPPTGRPPSPEQLDKMIRAYYPWPGVWAVVQIATTNKQLLTINKLGVRSQKLEVRIKFLPENKLQVEGGKPMSYKDFVNGYPNAKDVILPILPI